MNKESEIIFTEITGKGGNIGQILLNRPNVLNALSFDMCVKISNALAKWATNDYIKAVFIKGVGDRAFCAGGDIREIYKQKDTRSAEELSSFFHEEYTMNARLFHFPKPYIAFLDGITMGGGVGVSIHGSHQIATEKFSFAMPETAIGFFPDIGASYYLSRCKHQIGWYLALTGKTINSADALACCFITHTIPHNQLQSIEQALIETPFEQDSFATVTDILNTQQKTLTEQVIWPQRKFIEKCFSQEKIDDIFSCLNDLNEPFAKEALKLMSKRSPTSLKVSLAQLHKAKSMHFNEIMQMEYDMVHHFLKGHDFFEGIRAILIDKDQNPKWQPANLHEVSDESVEEYFSPHREQLQLSGL